MSKRLLGLHAIKDHTAQEMYDQTLAELEGCRAKDEAGEAEDAKDSMLRQGLSSDIVRARRFAAENKKAAEEFCQRHGVSIQSLIDQLAAKDPDGWNDMLGAYEDQQKIYRRYDEYKREKNSPEKGR